MLSGCAQSILTPPLACGPAAPPVPSAAYQDKSLEDLKSLASKDQAAARVVGERYQHGEGVGPDMKQAVDWYQRAASTAPTTMPVYMPGYGKVPGTVLIVPGPSSPGDAIAMAHLGPLYIDGNAVPRDVAHGQALLACAAGRGASL